MANGQSLLLLLLATLWTGSYVGVGACSNRARMELRNGRKSSEQCPRQAIKFDPQLVGLKGAKTEEKEDSKEKKKKAGDNRVLKSSTVSKSRASVYPARHVQIFCVLGTVVRI